MEMLTVVVHLLTFLYFIFIVLHVNLSIISKYCVTGALNEVILNLYDLFRDCFQKFESTIPTAL